MDILDEVYKVLKSDPFIAAEVGNRIKYYEYPATGDITGPIIVLEEVGAEMPGDYADGQWLTEDYMVHIEVWVQGAGGRKKRDAIARQIRNIMWEKLGFSQVASMDPEWDKDTNTYRDARRYRGKAYREDFDAL
ncbi:DUF3168 domain-containing protein [Siminovitchia fortis]|uniref:DUF3168 domain-containing protein n=1 Tax=Siminovitchia fortis TaxID=254758 RepID=A0A443IMT1_9BACI|nr:DUF3168 domain-containing protein [Siminovitchia fortis]RWR06749.1 DUF3168 domain-containing protein [Siminovitchia fortis]WHY83017.1 DUF3168 domain-containing protein [Siminovitchia fortis]